MRQLHLKGEALHPVLARGRRPSTDCDVLVDPDRIDDLCRALERNHWENVTSFEHGSVFGHAATFHHRLWGTVDVHRAFPGLDDDPRRTFEHLWDGREEVELGGIGCAVPSLTDQRLILLVHAARDAMGRGGHDVLVSWEEADDAERGRIDAIAEQLGAMVPLALVTDRDELASGRPDEHLWRAVHAGADPTTVWRARFEDAGSVRRKLALLGESLRVNRDHLGLRLGHDPSRAEIRREWWSRWGRMLRSLRSSR